MATHDLGEAITLADRIVVLAGRPARIRTQTVVPGRRPRSVSDVADFEKSLRLLLQDN
jgi:NitT/TauT family transport system ATP-binding protein